VKKVNFISPLPPHKQYELRRWFWCTALLWIISFMIGAYCVVPQLVTFIALKKEINALHEKTASYSKGVNNRDALKSEHELLSKQSSKINQYIDQPKNPHQYIVVILEASGNGVKLESLKFNKKNVELTILCPTPEHATVFIKRLSLSDLFTGIKLVSLQHDPQTKQLRAVIKGNIVF
jgi:hypothetical protein